MSAPPSGSTNASPSPGYYADPSIPGYIRYWDGSAWVPGTSRPEPRDGEPLPAPPADSSGRPAPAPGPGSSEPAPTSQPLGQQPESSAGVPADAVIEWDDPARLHGNRPEGGASWGAGVEESNADTAPSGAAPEDVAPAGGAPSEPGSAAGPAGAGGRVLPGEVVDSRTSSVSSPGTSDSDAFSAAPLAGLAGLSEGASDAGDEQAGGAPWTESPARADDAVPSETPPIDAEPATPLRGVPAEAAPVDPASGRGDGAPAGGRHGGSADPRAGWGGTTAGGHTGVGTAGGTEERPAAVAPSVGGDEYTVTLSRADAVAQGSKSPESTQTSGADSADSGPTPSSGSPEHTVGLRREGKEPNTVGLRRPTPEPNTVGLRRPTPESDTFGLGLRGAAGQSAPEASAGGAHAPSGPPATAPGGVAIPGPATPPAGTGEPTGANSPAPALDPARPTPETARPAIPAQSAPPWPGAPETTSGAPAAPGGPADPGGRQSESVQPWRPPVANPFEAALQTVHPAGLGRRLGARVVDLIPPLAVLAAAFLLFFDRAKEHVQGKIDAVNEEGVTRQVWLVDGTTGVYLAAVLGALVVLGLLWEVLPTARWGRTPGKKLFGVRVLEMERQEPPRFGAALVRWLSYGVLGVCVVGIVNVLWCLFDRPWRQCWHDKLARTFVGRP